MTQVRRMARGLARCLPPTVRIDDLVAAGNLGLATALSRFAHHREGFEGYAMVHARGAMLDELRRCDPMTRVGRSKARRAKATAHALASRLGRKAEEGEVAEAMGMALDEYRKLTWSMEAAAPTKGLNGWLDERAQAVADESVPADEQLDQARVRRILAVEMERLPARQAAVVGLSYEEGETLESIARTLGVSTARAHQLRQAALRRLKAACAGNDVLGAVA